MMLHVKLKRDTKPEAVVCLCEPSNITGFYDLAV